MADYTEAYVSIEQNAEIAASGNAVFGQSTASKENKNKFGSFNSLLISSLSGNSISVYIDGLSSKQFGVLQGAGTIKISPEDGIFFDWIQINNLSASTVITANDVNVRTAIALPRRQGRKV